MPSIKEQIINKISINIEKIGVELNILPLNYILKLLSSLFGSIRIKSHACRS
jgi:hypothetical protein